MSVIDCCMVFNEIDMLELRLNTLDSVVDQFVIVEAGMTHSGKPKPMVIGDALRSRSFAPFADKIAYSFTGELHGANSWERERYQRGLIADVLGYVAQPGDLVIVGDTDEIPRPEAVRQIPPQGARLELDFYYYSLNWRVREGWSIGALPYGVEDDPNRIRTLQGHDDVPTINHAGWHLSYFLSPEKVVEKVDAFMHHADVAKDMPRDPAWVAARMKAGQDLFGRTIQIEHVPADDLPVYVQQHPRYYKALGWVE